jgi:hypothetical protein
LRFLPAGDDDVARTTTVPVSITTTTAVPQTTTTSLETVTTEVSTVVVPDVIGLSVEEAQSSLEAVGLRWTVMNEHFDAKRWGYIVAQGPEPGDTVAADSVVSIETPLYPTCLDYQSDLENARSTTVHVLFECAPDGLYPNVSTSVTRVLPMTGDLIEATLQELLAGPTDEERAMGFSSWFSAESASALNSITLEASKLTVDFNDAIIINNASTSTGGMFLMAELQANLFQFPEVDSIEFQIDGSCVAFGNWMQIGECAIWTRADWEQRVAAWDAERALQPGTGDEVSTDSIVGTTFTTGYGGDPQRIMAVTGNTPDGNGLELFDSGYDEVGGWLLDESSAPDLKNWALHVSGQNAEMIWLVRSEGQADSGSMIYTVRAVLEIPWWEIEDVMQSDPFVRDGASACTRNGVSNPRLVVVAEVAEADGGISDYMNPLLAWMINVDGARFVEIPVDGIECLLDLS